MTMQESQRLAIVENEISHIKETTLRIEKLLETHVQWEEKKYAEMEKKFATKSAQEKMEVDLANLPNLIEKKHALKWVEKIMIGIIIASPALIFSLISILF